ncbi:recombinase family protein [Flexithrix dorotheae]|uniref:recombinase family protein n=1 Tax=Flexithrix dorotheae TaxID=70993 RepID=UPI000364F695|nr:recombinase family protein [Flexithrix dorotheae]
MKGVIFVRVSKKEQDFERQLQDLRTIAKSMKINIIKEITEKIGGSTSNKKREGIQELLFLAQTGQIEKVLVQEVSRLGRSTVEVLKIVEELTKYEVSIYVQNFGIETLKDGKKNPVAQFLFTILAEFSRLEKETLRERILSGLAEARRKGVKIGRPKDSRKVDIDYLKGYPKVVKCLKGGFSLRQTAKLSEVSVNTVRRVKLALENKI